MHFINFNAKSGSGILFHYFVSLLNSLTLKSCFVASNRIEVEHKNSINMYKA